MSALYMDALIKPNRPLTKRGLRVVMIITIVLACIPGLVFWLMGAWMAPMFIGLDVLALYAALRISQRIGLVERVQVSADTVEVIAEHADGRRRALWTSPTTFTRVDVAGFGNETRVRLYLSRKRLTVGAALSPDERREFGGALEAAIRKARAERYPSQLDAGA